MADYRFKLPSLSALSAFESAARHCNFSRAADELRTSQPAVSRHVSGLEGMLGAALFERERNRVSLTPDGQRLYHAVVAGFQEIGRAIDEIAQRPQRQTLTIACSYDVAHLWLMPRHDGLQDLLGAGTDIRIVASEYEHQALIQDRDTDISLTYLNPLPDGLESVHLFDEEVFPLCAPGFAERYGTEIAAGDLARLPLLHLSKRNFGWASWETWFGARGKEVPQDLNQRRFSSYVYLLEAASEGVGLALGWAGLVERYLDQGRLVRIAADSLRTGGGFRAVINRRPGAGDVVEDAVAYLQR